MKKIFFYALAFTLILVQSSCTDESSFNSPSFHQLERGAFAKFSNGVPAAAYPDPAEISFSDQIIDPNNNISSYKVNMTAVISGTQYVVKDFFTAASFPANFSFTTETLAESLGIAPGDIGFGDTFAFVATATRNDGTVFNGVAPTVDEDELTVGIGNTEAQLQTLGYNSAMAFNTIVACPFTRDDMLGTYSIISAAGFWGPNGGTNGTGETFEVIAGAAENEIILVNPYGGSGNFNITVSVSPFGLATVARQDAYLTEEVCCAGYSPTNVRSNANVSLALSCIGYIELNFSTSLSLAGGNGTGFTFGDIKFTAQKN